MRHKQSGVSLFVALIALVVMMLGGISLVRSVHTANLIAGNSAFKTAALNLSDIGVELAFNSVVSLYAPKANVAVANTYYPVIQQTDAQGLPIVNWSNVTELSSPAVQTGYHVKYVVVRMCTPLQGQLTDGTATGPDPANTSGIVLYCDTVPDPANGLNSNSKAIGGFQFNLSSSVFYSISVRVDGPHGATSYVQAMVSV